MENVKIEELIKEIKEISEEQKEKIEEYINQLETDDFLPSFDELKEELEESED